jgi:integration host factor subunit alpha
MGTVKRDDFAKHISGRFGFPIAAAARIVGIVFGEITEALKYDEEVKITNFGTFGINGKKERIGRNPKTKKPAVISARRVPTFRAASEFRSKVRKMS